MSEAPDIFDNAARRTRRARAIRRANRQTSPAFLLERCAHDAAERLRDISRTFERALIIAPPAFMPLLLSALPSEKHPKTSALCYDSGALSSPMTDCRDDALPFKPDSFDLVISILSLHSLNDLPGGLMNISHVLAPDGLMLAAYFGGNTLSGLRQSLYRTETQQLGGLTPRVAPMIDFSQSASLLQRAGFALPVVDTDRFTLSYETLSKLLSDLRDVGETNILSAREKAPLTMAFYKDLEQDLKNNAPARAGRFSINFEILWATGWAPHHSQQKPLKPGSAKMRLSEALGVKEQKL